MAGRSARRDITAKGRRHASSWAIEWPDTSRSELDGGLQAGMRSRLEPSPRLQCHAPTCDHAVCIPSAREHCCVVAVATHDNVARPSRHDVALLRRDGRQSTRANTNQHDTVGVPGSEVGVGVSAHESVAHSESIAISRALRVGPSIAACRCMPPQRSTKSGQVSSPNRCSISTRCGNIRCSRASRSRKYAARRAAASSSLASARPACSLAPCVLVARARGPQRVAVLAPAPRIVAPPCARHSAGPRAIEIAAGDPVRNDAAYPACRQRSNTLRCPPSIG